MKTAYPDGNLVHHVDLVEQLAGRFAAFRALGRATLDLEDVGRASTVLAEREIPHDLARGLVEIGDDLADIKVAIDAWFARRPERGAP